MRNLSEEKMFVCVTLIKVASELKSIRVIIAAAVIVQDTQSIIRRV